MKCVCICLFLTRDRNDTVFTRFTSHKSVWGDRYCKEYAVRHNLELNTGTAQFPSHQSTETGFTYLVNISQGEKLRKEINTRKHLDNMWRY